MMIYIKTTTAPFLILVFLGLIKLSGGKLSCQSNADCDWCGVCIDDKSVPDAKVSSCEFPFPGAVFKDGKCTKINLCEKNPCQHRALCKDEWGYYAPMCRCGTSVRLTSYGTYCEHKVPKKYHLKVPSGLGVFITVTDRKKSEENMYLVITYFTLEKDFAGSKLVISTSEGYIMWVKQSGNVCKDTPIARKKKYAYKIKGCNPLRCEISLPECHYLYVAEILFPYKRRSEEGVMTLDGRAVGYLANVTIEFSMNVLDQPLFYRNYQVFVNYENYRAYDIGLIPFIEVKNCARTVSGRKIFYRSTFITMEVETLTLPIDNGHSVVWKLWDVLLFREKFDRPKLYSFANSLSWSVPAFTLEASVYKYQVLVTNYHAWKQSNYVDCYFEVKIKPLVAFIVGGWRRSVLLKNTLIMSAEGSYDPNESLLNQDHVTFSWVCDKLVLPKNKTVYIPSSSLKSETKYHFTLTVSAPDLKSSFAKQEVTVVDGGLSISMHCVINCLAKVNPSDPLLLAVEMESETAIVDKVTWIFGIEKQNESAVDKIRDDRYPSHLLYVKPNSLSEGTTYFFEAKIDKKSLPTSMQMTVDSKPTGGACGINPMSGTVGSTLFKITCSDFYHENEFISYEFFDRYKSDPDNQFSGRMIDSNLEGVVSATLSRGHVFVYVLDAYGFTAVEKVEVELTVFEGAFQGIKKMLKEIQSDISRGETVSVFKKLSIIPDLVKDDMDKAYITKTMVELMSVLPMRNQGDMKVLLSIMNNLFNTVTKDSGFKFEPATVLQSSRKINQLTSIFKSDTRSDTITPYISRIMMELLAKAFLDVTTILLVNRHEGNFTEKFNIEDTDSKVLLDESLIIQEALNNIAGALAFRQGKGLKSTLVSSVSEHSSIVTETEKPIVLGDSVNSNEWFKLKLSPELLKELSTFKSLTIQSTSLRFNPYPIHRKYVSTGLLTLDLCRRSKGLHLKHNMICLTNLKNPIDLFLSLNSSKSGGFSHFIEQLTPTNDADELDRRVTVIRIELPVRCKLFLSFSFAKPNDSLKVLVLADSRPDYEEMETSYKIINSSHFVYEPPYNPTDSLKFVYIGILPGLDIPIGRNISYTMHYYCVLCHTLIRNFWVSQYCSVGDKTNDTSIHCRCTHLSLFSAVLNIPNTEIDSFHSVKLILTKQNNLFVVMVLILILIWFLLVSLWALFMAKKDKSRMEIIVLEDNFLWNFHFYVVAVFTGWRFMASTTANVGIRLIGHDGSSHPHILKSSARSVLQSNSDDWFLIRTSKDLGVLDMIHLWHDNTGFSPDWYCEKVVVYDMETAISYSFFMEDWLALDANGFCDVFVLAAAETDFQDFKRILQENMRYGFRNTHMCGGIFSRHPRHRLSRLDRVAPLMCLVMTAMLVSVLCYLGRGASSGVDVPSYSVGSQEFVIALITFIISSAVALLILFLFGKSYTLKRIYRSKSRISIYARSITGDPSGQDMQFLSLPDPRRRYNLSFYKNFVKAIRNFFKAMPLLPVSLTQYSTEIALRQKLYYLVWALSLLLIIICSCLVIFFSLKFEYQKSKMWLTAFVLAVLGQLLIISPIRIIVLSIVLASTHERLLDITCHGLEIEDIKHEESKSRKHRRKTLRVANSSVFKTAGSVMKTRAQSMYLPLKISEADRHKNRRAKQKLFLSLIDVVVTVAFILVLCFAVTSSWTNFELESNIHVKEIVQQGHSPTLINFKNIFNRTHLEEYLKETLVASLYKIKWYNLMSLNPPSVQDRTKFWTADFTTKLVGPPVLRQLRVSSGSCFWDQMFVNTSETCIPPWSPDVEDTDDYELMWETAQWRDKSEVEESSPWKYVDPFTSTQFSRQGASWTNYHGGGYVAVLAKTKYKTELILLNLLDTNWINEFTRVTFVVFTLYNVNRNLFTEVVLATEHLPVGLHLTRVSVDSVKLNIEINLWGISYILFLLFFLVRSFILLNRKGFVWFFSRFKYVYQLFFDFLGISSVVFYIINVAKTKTYVEKFQRKGLDEFNSFDGVIFNSKLSLTLVTALFCCLVLRVFFMWKFGRLYLNFCYSLRLSYEYLLWLLTSLLVVIFVFSRLLSYLLDMMFFFTSSYCLWSNSTHMFYYLPKDNVVIFIMCFLIRLIACFILIAFVYIYKTVKFGLDSEKSKKVKWSSRRDISFRNY